MEKLPASAGWQWVKDGFSLFRKQPAEMSTLFLSYLFLMLAVGIIPLLGQVLPIILVPAFSMAFMQACLQIERGKRVYPSMLFKIFRTPALGRLLQLGALYLIAAIVAVASSALIDGGVFWQVMSGQLPLNATAVRSSNMTLAMIFAAVVYTPAIMAFWHAAPLITWQNMGVGKALFYSFFAVRRAGKAFLVYGLAWVAIGVILPSIASSILALVFGQPGIVMMLLLPLTLVMTVVMYCSFYPTYTQIFGKPEQPA
ncbi:BPSS1780 family membrane protein [Noviherbaspirillum massiliense]|uniref:BPSS1780 family membrane protein n=1 Tax=Noviherbaspirillum massiliense TaxID=1465823 RepID=UPI0003031D1F|nr:BPSS1780 family membrane protein [Noviherbaspirillum massiliense]